MKLLKITLVLLILGSITAFVMQEDDGGTLDKKIIKYLHKKSSWRQVDDSLFMFETEVSNEQYFKFIDDLKSQDKNDEYQKYYPDSMAWFKNGIDEFSIVNPISELYSWHPKYKQHPVINISHKAALAYCNWLEKKLNSNQNKFKKFFKKVKVRLPTRKEWELASIPPYENLYPIEWKEGRANFLNVNQNSIVGTLSDTNYQVKMRDMRPSWLGEGVIKPCISYNTNFCGLYNTFGNVAEMLAEPGTTAGGSWGTTAYYLRLDIDTDPYKGWTKPSPFIGFRPVMEVIEE